MAKKIGKYDIPLVRRNGKLQMMEYLGWKPEGLEWHPNDPFTADLALNGHWRGRSSARVGVIDIKTGNRYSMGFASFYDAVDRGQFVWGVDEPYAGKVLLTGRWQCRKAGANYILVPLEDGVA